MADNPERLAQIMQRMQVSNQRTLGNRFGGGYSGTSSANAPTPPSQQIDFSQNTLSPPSMAEPDDTGPGQQMPSVIQPPAPSPMGMPSGGNAYLGNQQSASPSTRDLYSLPDYSGKMGGGIGGGFDIGRLLKLLSNYMGSQMAPPSAAPTPAPVEATPPSIDQSELQKPVEYTGGSQLPAPSPAPTPAPSPSPGSTPVPAGIKAPDSGSMNTSVMGEMYNPKTSERYTTRSGGYSAEPGSGWVSQGQPGYVAGTPGQATPDMRNKFGQPSALPKGLKQSNSTLTVMANYYNDQTGQRYTGGPGMAEPGSGWREVKSDSYDGQGKLVSQDPINMPGFVGPTYSAPTIPSLPSLVGTAPSGIPPVPTEVPATQTPSPGALPSTPIPPSTPAAPRPQLKGLTYPKPGQAVDMSISTLYNPETGEYASGGGGVYPEPGSAWRQATYEESKLRPSRALKG